MNQEKENLVIQENVLKEDFDTSMNMSFQPNNKRGPTTPLAGSKHTNSRRKLIQNKNEVKFMRFDEVNKREYIEMEYQNWLMKRNLDRHQELLKFMEMERKFTLQDH